MEQTTIYQECLYPEIEGKAPDFRECGIKCENCKYSITLEEEVASQKEKKKGVMLWT